MSKKMIEIALIMAVILVTSGIATWVSWVSGAMPAYLNWVSSVIPWYGEYVVMFYDSWWMILIGIGITIFGAFLIAKAIVEK